MRLIEYILAVTLNIQSHKMIALLEVYHCKFWKFILFL